MSNLPFFTKPQLFLYNLKPIPNIVFVRSRLLDKFVNLFAKFLRRHGLCNHTAVFNFIAVTLWFRFNGDISLLVLVDGLLFYFAHFDKLKIFCVNFVSRTRVYRPHQSPQQITIKSNSIQGNKLGMSI